MIYYIGGVMLAIIGIGWVLLPVITLIQSIKLRTRITQLTFRLNALEFYLRQFQPQHSTASNAAPIQPQAESVLGMTPTTPSVPAASVAPNIERISYPLPVQAVITTPKVGYQEVNPTSADKSRANRWEHFMGAKLFAWIGGIALFFGIVFFVKYSFDRGLLSPEARISIGYLIALCLLVSGILFRQKATKITSHTLCSTGLLILYAVTFACRNYYHFPAFTLLVTFGLMTLVTLGAFILSLRLSSMVIAVLGLAGGFITPFLLTSSNDAPTISLGYIALLNIGLLTIAVRKRWEPLPYLAAIGTAITIARWNFAYLALAADTRLYPVQDSSHVFGSLLVSMLVMLGFGLIFFTYASLEKKTTLSVTACAKSAVGFGFFILLFGYYYGCDTRIGTYPGLFMSYVLIAELGILIISLLRKLSVWIWLVSGMTTFVLLFGWLVSNFQIQPTPYSVFIYYVAFSVMHTFAAYTAFRIQPTKLLKVALSTFSIILPFILLCCSIGKVATILPVVIFGVALLLIAVVFYLVYLEPEQLHFLPLVGLVSLSYLEYVSYMNGQIVPFYSSLLSIYIGFYILFNVYPFCRYQHFKNSYGTWIAAALSGVFQFYFIYVLLRFEFPALRQTMGIIPAAFAITSGIPLRQVISKARQEGTVYNHQIAWYAAVVLFFITIIFPIQLENEWLTIAWALEGAALCWLYRRVPYTGIKAVGVGLFAIVFARLALNPSIFYYHSRSNVSIVNWYLYTYGIAAASMFVGAYFLRPPRNILKGKSILPLIYTLGTILTFLLVNIEIADYFTAPGAKSLTFEFSTNLARDMTYSIAWALFALALLIIGIYKRLKGPRYTSLALLGVTMIKLFVHDLANLGALYRIGAFVSVAVIAMFASFLYQKFLVNPSENDKFGR